MEYPHLVIVTLNRGKKKEETIGTFFPYTYLLVLEALEYNRKIYLQRLEEELDFALIGLSNDNSALRLEIQAVPMSSAVLYILARSLLIDENGKEEENTNELIKLLKYHPTILHLYNLGGLLSKPYKEYIT